MLESTYNLFVFIAWFLFVGGILLFLYERKATMSLGIYKFVVVVIAAVLYFVLAVAVPEHADCVNQMNKASVASNVTTYENKMQCGTFPIAPDRGTIYLNLGMAFMSVLLAGSWVIIGLSDW